MLVGLLMGFCFGKGVRHLLVNLAAFANYCQLAKEHSNIVSCDVGTEIGAGLIINDSLYRGQNNIAGETGFFVDDLSKPADNYNELCTLKALHKKCIDAQIIPKDDNAANDGVRHLRRKFPDLILGGQ